MDTLEIDFPHACVLRILRASSIACLAKRLDLRYLNQHDKQQPYAKASVAKKYHPGWSAKIFAGFFPRTGGDIVIPYGEETEYTGHFNTEMALDIFRNKAPSAYRAVPDLY